MLSMSQRAPGYRLNNQVPPTLVGPLDDARPASRALAAGAARRDRRTRHRSRSRRSDHLTSQRLLAQTDPRACRKLYCKVFRWIGSASQEARVKVPFTWKVTGWFMVGWSAEFPVGEVRPLRYFGEDLVAYRDEDGELHVMEAHCQHLGAHIGHGGKVVGDCVECPFHGWRWGPDGTNRYIPYQPDRPNEALRLRVYPVTRAVRLRVRLASARTGKEPQWELPDIFHKFPQFPTDPDAYYRPYPEFSRRAEHEPVHPQIVAENGPDSAHFHYVHGATVTPVCLDWEIVDEEWRFLTGWPDARSDDPDKMALLHPQPLLRTRLRDQRVRGIVEPPADLRLHARRRRVLRHVLFDLVAHGCPATPPTCRPTRCASRSRSSSWARSGMTWTSGATRSTSSIPRCRRSTRNPIWRMRKWATQFYEVPASV